MEFSPGINGALRSWLADLSDCSADCFSFSQVSGGCIHSSFQANWVNRGKPSSLFIKLAAEGRAHLLSAERESLNTLRSHPVPNLKIPAVQGFAELPGGFHALALEWLPMSSNHTGVLGTAMAQLYQATESIFSAYGFPSDNFIGASPQGNTPTSSWVEFFANRRIRKQVEWAHDRGFDLPPAESLVRGVYHLLTDQRPDPPSCLLHGDLWSGNAGITEDGQAVIFDPACYYGDPWADLAISELFGGFDSAFYKGVSKPYPRPAEDVMETYKVYHLLNHLNLFGESYLAQTLQALRPALRFS